MFKLFLNFVFTEDKGEFEFSQTKKNEHCLGLGNLVILLKIVISIENYLNF